MMLSQASGTAAGSRNMLSMSKPQAAVRAISCIDSTAFMVAVVLSDEWQVLDKAGSIAQGGQGAHVLVGHSNLAHVHDTIPDTFVNLSSIEV